MCSSFGRTGGCPRPGGALAILHKSAMMGITFGSQAQLALGGEPSRRDAYRGTSGSLAAKRSNAAPSPSQRGGAARCLSRCGVTAQAGAVCRSPPGNPAVRPTLGYERASAASVVGDASLLGRTASQWVPVWVTPTVRGYRRHCGRRVGRRRRKRSGIGRRVGSRMPRARWECSAVRGSACRARIWASGWGALATRARTDAGWCRSGFCQRPRVVTGTPVSVGVASPGRPHPRYGRFRLPRGATWRHRCRR